MICNLSLKSTDSTVSDRRANKTLIEFRVILKNIIVPDRSHISLIGSRLAYQYPVHCASLKTEHYAEHTD